MQQKHLSNLSIHPCVYVYMCVCVHVYIFTHIVIFYLRCSDLEMVVRNVFSSLSAGLMQKVCYPVRKLTLRTKCKPYPSNVKVPLHYRTERGKSTKIHHFVFSSLKEGKRYTWGWKEKRNKTSPGWRESGRWECSMVSPHYLWSWHLVKPGGHEWLHSKFSFPLCFCRQGPLPVNPPNPGDQKEFLLIPE